MYKWEQKDLVCVVIMCILVAYTKNVLVSPKSLGRDYGLEHCVQQP